MPPRTLVSGSPAHSMLVWRHTMAPPPARRPVLIQRDAGDDRATNAEIGFQKLLGNVGICIDGAGPLEYRKKSLPGIGSIAGGNRIACEGQPLSEAQAADEGDVGESERLSHDRAG